MLFYIKYKFQNGLQWNGELWVFILLVCTQVSVFTALQIQKERVKLNAD